MISKKNNLKHINIVLLSILMFVGLLFIVTDSHGYTITELSTVDWYVTYGGEDSDEGWDCAVDSNNNSYLIGSTRLGGGTTNATLLKYDNNGSLIWERHWGGVNNDIGNGGCTDSVNNVYLVGSTRSLGADLINGSCFIAKYDENGSLMWNRTWGTSGFDSARDVLVDSSFNVHITGYSYNSTNGRDSLYLKYNSSGDLQFALNWGGTGSENGYGIEETTTGDIVISGQTDSYGAGNRDVFVLYYSAAGSLIWNKTWGTPAIDRGYDNAIDSTNNIYVAGWTYYPNDLMASAGIYNINFVLIKFDSNGNTIWSRIWGRENMDYGIGVDVDSEDNIYFVGDGTIDGWGLKNIYIGKFNSSGILLSETLWGGGDFEAGHAITINKATNDIYVAGDSSSYNLEHSSDLVMIKNPTFPSVDIQESNDNQDSDDPQDSDSIPGYSVILTLCVFSVTMIILLRMKHRKK